MSQVTRPNLSFMSDPLDSQCSFEHMNTVASKCNFDWKVVGRRLVGEQAIVDIDQEEQSEQRKRDRMFQKWLEMEGSKATYKVLIDIIINVQIHQAAEAVKALVPKAPMKNEGRCCY